MMAFPKIKCRNCHRGLALTGRDVVGRATALVGRDMALVGRDMMRSQVVDLPWSLRLSRNTREPEICCLKKLDILNLSLSSLEVK